MPVVGGTSQYRGHMYSGGAHVSSVRGSMFQ